MAGLIAVFLICLNVHAEELSTVSLSSSLPLLQENVKAGCDGRGRDNAREAINRENLKTLGTNSEWVSGRVRQLSQTLAQPTEPLDQKWDREMDEKIKISNDEKLREQSALRDLLRDSRKNSEARLARAEALKTRIADLESQIEKLKEEKQKNRPSADPKIGKEIVTQAGAELKSLSKLSQQYQSLTRDAGFCLWDSQGRPGMTPEDAEKQAQEDRKTREKGDSTQNMQMSPSFAPLDNRSPLQIIQPANPAPTGTSTQ